LEQIPKRIARSELAALIYNRSERLRGMGDVPSQIRLECRVLLLGLTFQELDLDFMARIYPFRALRYNSSLVRLEDVVTQPYDKITPAMQQAYYGRSPYNLVRIILGLPELFDSNQDGESDSDIYTRAARDFRDWRAEGILAQESEPSIFAYSQSFRAGGELKERRGLIALGELSEYEDKVIFRHEQTLSKPKNDRLKLLRATRAHFGQIFMLYSDPGMSVERLLFETTSAPDMEVTDEYEVTHRVWRVNDAGIINLVTTALEDKKLIIADGHHRYETALNYAKERKPLDASPQGERNTYSLPQPPYAEAAVMMTFVNMDSDGLVILPAHRVVHGLKGFESSKFLESAQAYFDVSTLAGSDPAELLPQLEDIQNKTAFIAVTADGSFLLTEKSDATAELLAKFSARQRQLDVVHLHAVVLEELLGLTAEAIREQTNLRYVREAPEVMAQVQEREADIAFLVNPVTLDQLREVAFAGEVMPQKSTDFYPKLLSGLTVYALD
jgi:uncharacterized protein (DUF1015 family)